MSALPADRPAGYVELLVGNQPFRRLFLARVISLLGDWFNTLAVLALLRDVGGNAALAFGWVLILKTAPSVLMTPFAGVLVDRVPRKLLMVFTDLLRAVLVLSLFVVDRAPGTHGPTLMLYIVIFVMTAARAVSEPARNAVVPDLVRRQDLVTANAMGAAAWSLMFTVGTALGGLVTAGFGWRVALGIDAGTYLISAALVVGLPIPLVPGLARAGSRSFVAGLRYLAARPALWTLAAVKTGWSLAGGITLVLTILGERVYASAFIDYPSLGDPKLLGVTVLYVARGLGTGLGPIVSRWYCGADPRKSEIMIGVGLVWGAAFYLLLAFTESLGLAVACIVLAHLGGATVWVFSTVRLQAMTPTEVRGRVFACEQGGFMLAMATSTYVFSWAIDQEVAPLSTITGVLGGLLLLAGGLWWVRGALVGFAPRLESV